MFSALNLVRDNLSNAVSDNMLPELGLSQGNYVRLPASVIDPEPWQHHLPRRLLGCRAAIPAHLQAVSSVGGGPNNSIGPDRWIPIQIMIFSFIAAMQFFLDGRASFLATRWLM
jgi:hypothetical protein